MKEQTYYVIECEKSHQGKTRITKITAIDFTDALLKFKAKRMIKNLPYETIIAPEDQINIYPKGV